MKYALLISSLFLFNGFLFNSTVYAFPEMVRMGYQNCIACHISPTGTGILNDYGRSMASEVLSTWHVDGEEAVGHGLIRNKDGSPWRTPDWLKVGGDSRWIDDYVQSLQGSTTALFPMENELQATVHPIKQLWVEGSIDLQAGPYGSPNFGNVYSRTHYVMFNVLESLYLRAGKYLLPFGTNQPNHTIFTRQNLGWSEGTESYNGEVGFIGDNISVIATGDFGRPDDPSLQAETGGALSSYFNIGDGTKIGLSQFVGSQLDTRRYVLEPNILLGFTEHLIFVSELAFQWTDFTQAPEQRGPVTYNKLQFEVYKGVNIYAVHQLSYLNLNDVGSRTDALGIGLQFFPRPHFEFTAEYDAQRTMAIADRYFSVAWLLMHYYL